MLLRTHIQLTEKEIEYGAEVLIEILYIDECINWRRNRIFHFEEMFVCNERRGECKSVCLVCVENCVYLKPSVYG